MATGGQNSRIYEFDHFRIDAEEGLLWRDGEVVPLTPKAFEMLVLLLENNGHVVKKEVLMERIWPETFVEEANLTNNISLLRRVLQGESGEQHYIKTVPRRGYRFVANVREQPVERADVTQEKSLFAEKKTHGGPRGVAALLAAIVLLSVVGIVYYFYSARTDSRAAIDSIAVLPLVNTSNDPNTEYLSDGISESLINSLAELQQLRVVARATAFRYKGQEVDPQVVGRDLKVRAVLMGRVRQMGDVLNIQVDLVDATTGTQLWGEEYERKGSELVSVKQAIARRVIEKLRLRLSAEEQQRLARRDPTNADAYQSYLRGRYFWNKRTAEGLTKAIEQFQEAINRDQNYALGHAGLADTYALLNFYSTAQREENFPRAKAAVQKALALDDTLVEAHTTLAYVKYNYEWEWESAEVEFRRAIALNPSYATAHQWYAEYLMYMERFDESLTEIKRAHELEPFSLIINFELGSPYLYMRQYDKALETYNRVLEMDPNFPFAIYGVARCYEQQGRYNEAIAEYNKLLALSGNKARTLSALGYAYAISGQKPQALGTLRKLTEQAKQESISPYLFAIIHAGLGDKEQALALLSRAYEERDERIVMLRVDPRLDSLRADERFHDLLRRVRLAQ